jgi:hypothetical protein
LGRSSNQWWIALSCQSWWVLNWRTKSWRILIFLSLSKTRCRISEEFPVPMQENLDPVVPSVRSCVHTPLRSHLRYWRSELLSQFSFNTFLSFIKHLRKRTWIRATSTSTTSWGNSNCWARKNLNRWRNWPANCVSRDRTARIMGNMVKALAKDHEQTIRILLVLLFTYYIIAPSNASMVFPHPSRKQIVIWNYIENVGESFLKLANY